MTAYLDPANPATPNWLSSRTPWAYAHSSSVRGLGRAVEALLGLYVLANTALIFPVWHELTLLHRLQADPRSVALDEAQRADDSVHRLALLGVVLYLAVIIVWLVWFHRVRDNVEVWDPAYQRRGTGWAIGGWFCPIVNYWFPYQIARDVLDDTDRDLMPPGIRAPRTLLLSWWLAFIAMNTLDVATRGADDNTVDQLITSEYFEIADIVLTLVAGALAIAVVRRLTAAQTDRRARAYTELQAAPRA